MISWKSPSNALKSTTFFRISRLFIPCLPGFFCLIFTSMIQAQGTCPDGLYGQKGIVFTPGTELQTDRYFTFGGQYIPASQAHLKFSQKRGFGEYVPYIRIGFLPWAEASIRLVYPEKASNGEYGIGDRSIFLKFRVLSERKYVPAIAIGAYDPIGTKLLPASFIVASKSVNIWTNRSLRATVGYGATLFGDAQYLVEGVWAGCQLLPASDINPHWFQWSVGGECHRRQINVTAGLVLFSIVQINAYLMDMKDVSVNLSASFRL